MNYIRPFVLRLRLAALLLAGVALASCGGGGGGAAAEPTARKSVGAAGGSLSSLDGTLTLTIPAGALGQDTEITITEVSSANAPANLKPLGADRIFKLGPDGLRFAQPVTAAVDLAAGNALAVMLIDSGGTTEYATGQRLDIGPGGRKLAGEIAHFSHLVAKTVDGFTLEFTVDKRQLSVKETVLGEAKFAGTAAVNGGGDVNCSYSPYSEKDGVLTMVSGGGDTCIDQPFFPGVAGQITTIALWECLKPGSEVARIEFSLSNFVMLLPIPAADVDSFTIAAQIDIVCTAGSGGAGLPTGVSPMPFGTGPDGLLVRRGPFAGVNGLLAYFAVAQGMVAIDLLTGLSVIDLTTGGSQGGVGRNLLGVQPIRASDSVSAVFGTSTSEGYLRNHLNGAWGFTQVGTYAYIDAGNGGGRIDAAEMITVAPTRGIEFVRFDSAAGFFNWDSTLSLPGSAFSGTLRSAVLPSSAPGSAALVLSAGTDGGTTSSVWAHPRQPGQPAVKLFSFAGGDARLMRCSEEAAPPAGPTICIATEYGTAKAQVFRHDRADPLAVPAVLEVPVGAGPIGVEVGTRANGEPVAVVSNYLAGSFNVIDFDATASLTANTTVALPPGCLLSAHAAAFSDQGKDYVAGTCSGSNSYFVVPLGF